MIDWETWVTANYGDASLENYKLAYAEVVAKEFADRYGSNISGWWFDHSKYGNIPRLHDIPSEAHPDATIAFNNGQKSPPRNSHYSSCSYEPAFS